MLAALTTCSPARARIVALEPIAADCEIRVNYEAEGKQGQYWSALGLTPSEGAWRVAPPALRPLDAPLHHSRRRAAAPPQSP